MNIVMCNECGWIRKEEELLANDTTLDEAEHCPSCGEEGFIADVDDSTIPFNDSELETLWKLFGDVPINNDDEIEEDFIDFPAGTYRFEIWHWFDELYSKGVKALTEVS